MGKRKYITMNVDVEIDLSDIDLDDIFEQISNEELKTECQNRGIISNIPENKDIDLNKIKKDLCDLFAVNHFTEWNKLFELINNNQ